MSPPAEKIIHRLESSRHRWWFFSLLSTCVLAACTSFGVWLIFTFGDAFLRFSQGILVSLFAIWFVVTGLLLWIVGRRLLLNQRGLEATARRVEAEFTDLGNSLINLLHLSETRYNGDPAFCEAAIRHAAQQAEHVNFDAAAARQSRWVRLRHCMQTPRIWPNRWFCCAFSSPRPLSASKTFPIGDRPAAGCSLPGSSCPRWAKSAQSR